MKILRLKAENFKRLEVVEIKPTGQVVKISGPNASGKSSVLDSIIAVLGGKTKVPTKPVRTGSSKSTVTLDLGGDKIQTTVTKVFRDGHPDELIIVPMRQGFTAQKFLDSLVGSISFDPLHFALLKPKEQFEILRMIVPLKGKDGKSIDPTEVDFQNAEDYKQRALLNRQVKELESRRDTIDVPQGTPDKEVDVSKLAAEIGSASSLNASIEVTKQLRVDSIARAKRNSELAKKKIDELTAALQQAVKDEARFLNELKKLSAENDPAPIDTSSLQKKIDSAQEINRNVVAKKRKKELSDESLTLTFKADDLTAAMEARTAAKMEALAKAKFPVPGLAFGSDEVLYGGLPFDQASTAEKLTVSLAIGMQLNPELKVMLIKEGTLLDEKSFAIVEKMAKNWDGQIWCEVVDTSGEVGIVMQDGHVEKVNE
jgi:predicted ATP-dependent endonuclease of OLD family